ncbi:MAG: 3'(2'),5'-bisphosphate nucleotidase CysQ [Rhizobiales bacterium]|nr:3'(2'),5'-bisphosphate nucleotidase CysQ [Hyphomicrobiales bacterium]MBN9008901.1 3'(2'),5'-bisphosphate nucleotidase CysQ [Hyphomicrobiales bacterium]
MASADDEADLRLLLAAAEEAGALAMRWFGHDPQTWPKGDTSIVSEADLAVDRLLAERLRGARPGYGWLSEETADTDERLSRRRVFVVDPIDGTRAFLAGEKEWTVALAVVEDGRPQVAVLAAPALAEVFSAARGRGAFLGGRRLQVGTRESLGGARLAGPKRAVRMIAETLGVPAPAARFVPSLAYRLALVAADRVDVAIAGPNAHDWDLAAADLIVEEAGGRLAGFDGAAPAYNGRTTTHPALVAANPAIGAGVARGMAEWQRRQEEEAS